MSKQNVEIAAFIGLDWADQQHAVCLQDADNSSRETSTLDQTPEGLQTWIDQLRARFGGRPVAVAVEQARGALIYALMHVDFLHLYPVNPQTLAKLRKAFYPSGAKDDPGDAGLLLEVLLHHRNHLRVWVPDDVLTRSIQLLTEGRRNLVGERTALTNQLTAVLKMYFPQALDWFGDLQHASCLRLSPALAFLATTEKCHTQFGAQVLPKSGLSGRRQTQTADRKHPTGSTPDWR